MYLLNPIITPYLIMVDGGLNGCYLRDDAPPEVKAAWEEYEVEKKMMMEKGLQ